jgi:hypothetical protein
VSVRARPPVLISKGETPKQGEAPSSFARGCGSSRAAIAYEIVSSSVPDGILLGELRQGEGLFHTSAEKLRVPGISGSRKFVEIGVPPGWHGMLSSGYVAGAEVPPFFLRPTVR